ncbi:neural cell adhesion molecule 1-A-like, partial [Diaphorina citri]|uniref:Neural cell adhesion molecule 1-A-like n=2 Tax=Diaphorina citri TaxID=121845 RepID=A0A3Q0IQ49_DIACI
PPRIIYVSGAGKVEVKKGYSVTLECKADGNPVPNITWTRKNNNLPGGEYSYSGNSLTVRHTNRHSAGIYLCVANNMVGSSAAASIALHVLYLPEIEVERSWVHSGEGYEAQLVCIVHAEPHADTDDLLGLNIAVLYNVLLLTPLLSTIAFVTLKLKAHLPGSSIKIKPGSKHSKSSVCAGYWMSSNLHR